jgi:hypothetical protein
MIFTVRRRQIFLSLLFSAFCGYPAIGQSSPPLHDADLRAVVVLMRHGVRAFADRERDPIQCLQLAIMACMAD